jgi:hypothetical protein
MPQAREKKLEIATRRKQVAALYLRRFTQQQIADQLGVDQKTVCTDIKAILAEYKREREDHIDREVAELEEMERDTALQFHGTKGREWISERRAIKERRAKMLGLDAPVKQEHSGEVVVKSYGFDTKKV